MGKKEDKIEQILKATTRLLAKQGMESLSMRKVADEAGIYLSNVQYYYDDRDALLTAAIGYYFDQSKNQLQRDFTALKKQAADLNELVRTLLQKHLVFDPSDERCKMLREIWALAARKEEIHEVLMDYYREYVQWLIRNLDGVSRKPEQVTALLLPYIEGYTIMGDALRENRAGILSMLADLVLNLDDK